MMEGVILGKKIDQRLPLQANEEESKEKIEEETIMASREKNIYPCLILYLLVIGILF